MKRIGLHIISLLFLLLIVVGMSWTSLYRYRKITGSKPRIRLIDIRPADKKYVIEKDILEKIKETPDDAWKKNPYAYLKQLEKNIESHPLITGADVWMTPDGSLAVRVQQIKPIALIQTSHGWQYLTIEGKTTPVSPHQKTILPKITGEWSTPSIREIYPVMHYIYSTPELRNSIKSIRNEHRQLWLYAYSLPVPVLLGDTSLYKDKLRRYRIMASYLKQKSRTNPYTRIDLRYKNQIVCTKNL